MRLFWMIDPLQHGLEVIARHNFVVRQAADVCAALVVYAIAAVWLGIVWARRQGIHVDTVVRIGVLAVVAYGAAKVLTGVVMDPRPYIVEHLAPLIPVAHDNGFPSDHVLAASVLTASLCFIEKRALPYVGAATLLVALGRLAIGAHHTEDVVGSMVIAAVALAIAAALPLPAAWRERRVLAGSADTRHGVDTTGPDPRDGD